jgi:hypothetical protein
MTIGAEIPSILLASLPWGCHAQVHKILILFARDI